MFSEWNKTNMAFNLANIVMAPFMLVMFSIAYVLLLPEAFQITPFIYTLIMAYYIVPNLVGIVAVMLAAWAVWRAWCLNTIKSRKAVLLVYIAVLLLFIGYIGWWYLTGQDFDYL
jgi:hypothetical protein